MIKLLFLNGGSVLFLTDGERFRYKAIPPSGRGLVKSFHRLDHAIAYAKTGKA